MPSSPFVPDNRGNTNAEGERLGGLDPRMSRTHYFDGRLLKASDLVRDQFYLDERLREAGRAFGTGISHGLIAQWDGGEGLSVSPGLAIAASGRVLELHDSLSVNLGDRAQLAVLNARFRRFNRGLYALVLQLVERGRDVAEVYPQDPAKRDRVRYNAFEEGVELALVRLDPALPMVQPLAARAQLARTFLHRRGQRPRVPDDAVAVALLGIDGDRIAWLDRGLVYRPIRVGEPAEGLNQDLFAHYSELLGEVLAARAARGLGHDFVASQHFSWLPPTGPLPKGSIDPVAGRQRYFPEHYDVHVAPVRAGDLPQVQAECMALDPLDLQSEEGAEVLVLAPMGDANFANFGRRLLRDSEPGGLRRLPHIDPLRLRFRPLPAPHAVDTDEAAWREIWARVDDGDLVYVRRPARVAETRVSAIVLARGFEPPEPVAEGPDPAELAAEVEALQAENQKLRSQLANVQAQLNKALQTIKELQTGGTGGAGGGGRGLDLNMLLDMRGVRDVAVRKAATEVTRLIAADPVATEAVVSTIRDTPVGLDKAAWTTLRWAAEAGELAAVSKAIASARAATGESATAAEFGAAVTERLKRGVPDAPAVAVAGWSTTATGRGRTP